MRALLHVLLGVPFFLCATVWAGPVQYRAVFLAPTDIYASEAHDISNGNVAGSLDYGPDQNFVSNPVVWLAPDQKNRATVPFGAAPAHGIAYAIFGDKVGGYIGVGNNNVHAALWTHGESRLADLNPVHFTSSYCFDVNADHQVGYAIVDRDTQTINAMLWSGSAHSAVDLDNGDDDSFAYAIAGDTVVGESLNHAAFWSVATHQMTDLQPDNFSGFSTANGVARGIQVGMMGGAVAWHSTAASAKFLQQGSFDATDANAVNDHGVIVGYATKFDSQIGNVLFQHAVVWPSESAAPVDLGQFLPAGIDSQALAIGQDGTIVGEANNHAVMWVPTATAIGLPLALPNALFTLMAITLCKMGFQKRG
jgi:hypothetical protein